MRTRVKVKWPRLGHIGMGFFAYCYQEHWRNETHYKVHLLTLFPKRNTTFHGVFLSRLSVVGFLLETMHLAGMRRNDMCNPFGALRFCTVLWAVMILLIEHEAMWSVAETIEQWGAHVTAYSSQWSRWALRGLLGNGIAFSDLHSEHLLSFTQSDLAWSV